jgi:hypothetical protein
MLIYYFRPTAFFRGNDQTSSENGRELEFTGTRTATFRQLSSPTCNRELQCVVLVRCPLVLPPTSNIPRCWDSRFLLRPLCRC